MEDLQGGTLALEHRYDLERRSGEFALFDTYRGTQHPFERPVSIKVCAAPAEFNSVEMYERLKLAVVETANIDHERVSRVVDFGDIEQYVPFVVSERAEGVTLQDYVETHGTLPPEEALEIARRIAEVLSDLHGRGFVHGGLAPKWVTIADEGVWLDHFALQPTMAEIRSLDGAILSSDLLWSLPPEQYGDEETAFETAADIWAVGALLYWMLSGVHPYFDDPTDTADAILRLGKGSRPRPLDELGVDEAVSDFVEKALQPKPDDRYATIQDFLDAHPLEDDDGKTDAPRREPAPARQGVPGPVVEAPASTGIGTALAVVLALLVLSNLGWFFYRTSTTPTAPTSSQTVPETPPSVLPSGVQVNSEPGGARVFRVTEQGGEEEFGDTPMVLDPKSVEGDKLPVIVRKKGYSDVRVDVVEGDGAHELIVHLPAAEPAAEK